MYCSSQGPLDQTALHCIFDLCYQKFLCGLAAEYTIPMNHWSCELCGIITYNIGYYKMWNVEMYLHTWMEWDAGWAQFCTQRKEDHRGRAWLLYSNHFVNKWWMGPVGYCCFQEDCWPSINQALSAVQYNPGIYCCAFVVVKNGATIVHSLKYCMHSDITATHDCGFHPSGIGEASHE